MAKRPKRVDRAIGKIPQPFKEVFSQAPVVHRAFWLPWDALTAHWIEAFEAIDKRADKQPLLDLLRSSQGFPRDARVYLADLLERHQLNKPRGAQRTPAYERTDVEAVLEWAIMDMRHRVKNGIRVNDAMEQTSKLFRVPLNLLSAAYRGTRRSTRRMKGRRP